jgi:hypothetical protein
MVFTKRVTNSDYPFFTIIVIVYSILKNNK